MNRRACRKAVGMLARELHTNQMRNVGELIKTYGFFFNKKAKNGGQQTTFAIG